MRPLRDEEVAPGMIGLDGSITSMPSQPMRRTRLGPRAGGAHLTPEAMKQVRGQMARQAGARAQEVLKYSGEKGPSRRPTPGILGPALEMPLEALERINERMRRHRQLQRNGINGYGYVPRRGEAELLARALYSEFSSEKSWDDMVAGAWSIINRIRPHGRWPSHRTQDTIGRNLAEVLERHGRDGTLQYSFMPDGGVAGGGGSAQWRASARPEQLTGPNRRAWKSAVHAANNVLNGTALDPTEGATHFHHAAIGRRSVKPSTVHGFFRGAQDGTETRPLSLVESRYRSPLSQNFFYHSVEDLIKPPYPSR